MDSSRDDLRLRPALAHEADALTALAFASKRLWGYDDDFMAQTGSGLVVTVAMIQRNATVVGERAGRIEGFSMLAVDGDAAEVELLFVAPHAVRRGVGRALWQRLIDDARHLGARVLEVTADPNAEGFYAAMGALRSGSVASSEIPGRFLPRLAFRLPTPDPGDTRERRHAA